MAPSIGVPKIPGASEQTRMPNIASSRAIGSVMPATAALVAEYAAWPIWPSKAATEEVWTITPRSPSARGRVVLHDGRGRLVAQKSADEVDVHDAR